MAEIFSIAAGTLSVAGLFTNCIQCLEYVQLGRQFGQAYEEYRLRLAVAETRLGRWGEAVRIHDDPRFDDVNAQDRGVQMAQLLLAQLRNSFETAYQRSRHYELVAEEDDLFRCEESDMRTVVQRLSAHLRQVTHQRQKRTSLLRKTTWALYDKKLLDEILKSIQEYLTALEQLGLHAETTPRQLVALDVEGVEDEESLLLLAEAARNLDDNLLTATEKKIQGIAERNSLTNLKAKDDARIRVGSEFSQDYRGTVSNNTTNTADDVNLEGNARFHVGNRYGGKGVFDD